MTFKKEQDSSEFSVLFSNARSTEAGLLANAVQDVMRVPKPRAVDVRDMAKSLVNGTASLKETSSILCVALYHENDDNGIYCDVR